MKNKVLKSFKKNIKLLDKREKKCYNRDTKKQIKQIKNNLKKFSKIT